MSSRAFKRGGMRLLPFALGALAGCASQPPERPAAPAAGQVPGVIEAPRSARGNPPFYEVLGRRYHVLDSSSGYRQEGVASWYGRDFHGLTTSGGEIYDMHALTAAHKTLPIPTWVEVTNLENGKRVIVKVNDRGPFVDDRIIDLSFRAAQTLGMVDAGTARVEVRALGAPAAEVAGAGSPPATAGDERAAQGFALVSEAVAGTPGPYDRPMEQMFVQVGAFAERANALQLVDRLRAGGYADTFMVSEGDASGVLHRVRIGPLEGVDEYDRVTRGLRGLGISDARLVVGP